MLWPLLLLMGAACSVRVCPSDLLTVSTERDASVSWSSRLHLLPQLAKTAKRLLSSAATALLLCLHFKPHEGCRTRNDGMVLLHCCESLTTCWQAI